MDLLQYQELYKKGKYIKSEFVAQKCLTSPWKVAVCFKQMCMVHIKKRFVTVARKKARECRYG